MSQNSTGLKVAVVGLGKMGLSHLSMLRPQANVDLVGVCDASTLVLDVLSKYTGAPVYPDAEAMLRSVKADAVVIATPTALHHQLVATALDSGQHVFCEKPLTLDPRQSRSLAEAARRAGLRHQVGYHYRFVSAFQECKRLLEAGAVGQIVHAQAEAYGPVMLKASGSTWRSRRGQGGGCLYDYAAHPIDLLNWYLGKPASVSGTVMRAVFSTETEDEVYATIRYPQDVSAQLSVNWSDASQRKMSTRVRVWGTEGMIDVDRQECQAFLRGAKIPEGYQTGWNVRYTTDLTDPVTHYVRGEEYSAQLEHFVNSCMHPTEDAGTVAADFTAAADTDEVIEMLLRDREAGTETARSDGPSVDQAMVGVKHERSRPWRRRVGAVARRMFVR